MCVAEWVQSEKRGRDKKQKIPPNANASHFDGVFLFLWAVQHECECEAIQRSYHKRLNKARTSAQTQKRREPTGFNLHTIETCQGYSSG